MKRRAGWIAVAAMLLSGCGAFTAPKPTPGELTDLVNALVLRGAAIQDQVAGDTGCGDPTLYGNAVRFDARLTTESTPSPIYLFRWKSQPTFISNKPAFDTCVAAFSAAHPDASIGVVEASPWRAYGDWSPELNAAVKEALEATAGS